MTRVRSTLGALLLAVLVLPGCVSQDDVDRAISDELRFSGRVMGFALEAAQQSVTTRIAVLHAFQGDPRLPQLEAELGTLAENQAKLERIQRERRLLIEEHQRLRTFYQPDEE